MKSSRWNELHKFPMDVILTDDDGVEHKTRTRSIAWDLCGHPVVMVEGRTGGYLLSRIRPDINKVDEDIKAGRVHVSQTADEVIKYLKEK